MNVQAVVSTYCPPILRPVLDRIERSPLALRLASGVFWTTVGTAVSRGLTLAAFMLIARMLGKAGYGQLGMVQSTITMLGTFAGFGLGLTATKHVAELRKVDPHRTGHILALSGLVAMATGGMMGLALFFGAGWLAEHMINSPQLSGALRIGALALFVSGINGAQTGALSGFEAFRQIARVNLITGLFAFPTLIGGAWLGGIHGALWALTINLCMNCLLNHLALRAEARRYGVRIKYDGCWREWPILWTFSLPAILAGSMVGPVNWICNAMLVSHPDGYGEFGLYAAANQWFYFLLSVPGMLGAVILPVLSNQLGEGHSRQSVKTLAFAVKLNLAIILPLAVMGSIVSRQIMSFYGEAFRDAGATLTVALMTAVLLAVQAPIGHVIAASGRMWSGFGMNAGWAIAFILGTYFLVDLGAFGLATARAVAYSLHTLWVLVFVYYLLSANIPIATSHLCANSKTGLQ